MKKEKLYIVNVAAKEYYAKALAVYAESPEEACGIAIEKASRDEDFLTEDEYKFQSDNFVMELFELPDPSEMEEAWVLANPDLAIEEPSTDIECVEIPSGYSEEDADEFL